jgi:asparagine synthase (glutamine-hydrolysing)
VGRRALFFAHAEGRLVVGSTPDAVARLRGPRRLNLAHLAGRAAGLLEAWDTAYEGVAPLPAGHSLVCELRADGSAGVPELRRHWTPPTFEQPGEPAPAAAERLRALLEAAVAERLDPAAPTAVWLSGGYDSTAVYGAGQAALRGGRADGELIAVSMSYPPGDAGREDELIAETASFWGGRVEWRQVDDVPLFGDAVAGARRRAGPFAHAFEQWMTTLALAARDAGARVVLDGSGGDQLFQVSSVFLADLLRTGRWRRARDEWRAMGLGGAGWRRFARTGVLPLLPGAALGLVGLLRGGRPPRGLRAGVVPPWIRPERRAELAARLELRLPRRRGESESARESRWYFETSYSAAVFAEQRAIARRAGVEVRSPLLDRPIVELAATRPREERAGGGETKRLLRHALRGRLPETVLATRRSRTGTTSHYYRRALLRELPAAAAGVLEESVLAALDVLDPGEYRAAIEQYRRDGDAELGAALFATAQAELWIRVRV